MSYNGRAFVLHVAKGLEPTFKNLKSTAPVAILTFHSHCHVNSSAQPPRFTTNFRDANQTTKLTGTMFFQLKTLRYPLGRGVS